MVQQFGEEKDPAKRIRLRQGELIRQYRNVRGMTQKALAASFDPPITEATVSQWENGVYTPRPHLQVQLAKILDFPWSAVFGLDRWT